MSVRGHHPPIPSNHRKDGTAVQANPFASYVRADEVRIHSIKNRLGGFANCPSISGEYFTKGQVL